MNSVEAEGRITRRARILDAAVEVIAIHGTDASFSAIAQHAGVSPALITYHFQNKKDLLLAVASAVNADMDRAFGETTGQRQNPGDGLRRLVEGFLSYAIDHPHAFLALQALIHALAEDERADSPAIAADRGIAPVSELVTAAQANGDIPTGPVRPVAIAVMGALGALAFDIATGRGHAQETRSAGVGHTLRMLGLES